MSEQGPPAGWYPHPEMAGTQRYWNGREWSGDVAPVAPAPFAMPRQGADAAVIAGWLLAFFMPPVGFLIGASIYKRKKEHAVGIMALSVLITGAYFAAWT